MAPQIRTLAATFYDGHYIAPHSHPWGQLIFAAKGVMRVDSGERMWIVPPAQAIWTPVKARHEIRARGVFEMRTLYVVPSLCARLSDECQAIEVDRLLRELVLEAVRVGMLDGTEPEHRRLIGVLLDRLCRARSLPLAIELPKDRRARHVAELLQANPADARDLSDLAREAGASARTLQRLFLSETGLRFSEWRQRLRLLRSATTLSAGLSVTEAGFDAGYTSTSAYVAAFRKQFGETPARFRDARAPAKCVD